MSKKLIPFRLLPVSWGLVGVDYEQARIKYEYQNNPYKRDIELAKLEEDDTLRKQSLLDVDLKYNKITAEEHDYKSLDVQYPEEHNKNTEEYLLEKLDLDLKYHKIDIHEYNYEVAEVKREPYVNVITLDVDKNNPNGSVSFELDWNELWIDTLREHGYNAPTDELILREWFDAVCRSIGTEMGLQEDQDYEVSMTRKFKNKNGKTTYT